MSSQEGQGTGPTSAEKMIGTGFAAIAGAVTGPAGLIIGLVAAVPMIALTHRVFAEFRHWRENCAALVVETAAEDLGLDAEGFEREVRASRASLEIFGEAVLAGGNTLNEQKVRALGRALANGLRDDLARVDAERLMIDALAAIEEPHVKVLVVLAEDDQRARDLGWLAEHLPEMQMEEIWPVVSVLLRQGLIASEDQWRASVAHAVNRLRRLEGGSQFVRPDYGEIKASAEESWYVSRFGHRCLDYLGEHVNP